MNRFIIIALVLAIALVGPVSAGTIFRYMGSPGSTNLRVAAGTINAAGAILGGSGFTVTHIATGEYRIVFARGYFTACAAMTVTNAQYPLVPVVTEQTCPRYFTVDLWVQNCSCKQDGAFQFTAIQEL